MKCRLILFSLWSFQAFAGDSEPRLRGGTDYTLIGNTGDRLKVDTATGVITRTTYSAAVTNLVTAVLATDVFTITGSATKTIRITKISIDGLAVTGGNFTVNLIKRSTANSGGTSTTLTNVPHDSTNTAATATIRAYTANPTLGTSAGTLRSTRVFISGGATTGSLEDVQTFGDLGQAVVLRGTSEVLALNLNGVTINTPTLNIWVEWTEES